jgi:hypothetical protein
MVEAERRIKCREVIPTPKGLSKFARELWHWSGKAVKSPRAIANKLRPIWNATIAPNK